MSMILVPIVCILNNKLPRNNIKIILQLQTNQYSINQFVNIFIIIFIEDLVIGSSRDLLENYSK